jgi:hypothetical protein
MAQSPSFRLIFGAPGQLAGVALFTGVDVRVGVDGALAVAVDVGVEGFVAIGVVVDGSVEVCVGVVSRSQAARIEISSQDAKKAIHRFRIIICMGHLLTSHSIRQHGIDTINGSF